MLRDVGSGNCGELASGCLPPRLQGRTHGLRKRLRHLADFVFVDGPHELPAWIKQTAAEGGAEQHEQPGLGALPAGDIGQHALRHAQQAGGKLGGPPRRAWLLTPEQHASLQQGPVKACSGVAPEHADEWQLLAQSEGWEESHRHLERVLLQQGPFDGVLGFSQGAAVAAVLAAQQWLQQRGQPCACAGADTSLAPARPRPLSFAILCSGYRSPLPAHRGVLERAAAAGGAALPTLHIYGSSAGECGLRC